MSRRILWRNPRPILLVEHAGGGQLGNCYSSSVYRVTSTRPLDGRALRALPLYYGQEFYADLLGPRGERTRVPEKLEWPENSRIPATGIDLVPAVEEDERTGRVIDEHPLHERTREPYPPTEMPHWVYEVETRIDSGD